MELKVRPGAAHESCDDMNLVVPQLHFLILHELFHINGTINYTKVSWYLHCRNAKKFYTKNQGGESSVPKPKTPKPKKNNKGGNDGNAGKAPGKKPKPRGKNKNKKPAA